MLRQRILTAAILAPLAIWGILALDAPVFSAVVGAIVVLAAWEWGRLAGLSGPLRGAYATVAALLLVALYPALSDFPTARFALIVLALLWWCAALIWVLRFPANAELWTRGRLAPAVAGLLVLIPAWAALVGLRIGAGPSFVLVLMVLIWGADVGAFFAGRRWGRHKLAPRVSPGKTWEGLFGALAAAALVALVAGELLRIPGSRWGICLGLCLFTVVTSVLGDLMESMFKRLAHVKDSSSLLPGHGGVLDRIDSVTAAAPVFALGIALLGDPS
jgi:phosphatidate cytidylyltransferase